MDHHRLREAVDRVARAYAEAAATRKAAALVAWRASEAEAAAQVAAQQEADAKVAAARAIADTKGEVAKLRAAALGRPWVATPESEGAASKAAGEQATTSSALSSWWTALGKTLAPGKEVKKKYGGRKRNYTASVKGSGAAADEEVVPGTRSGLQRAHHAGGGGERPSLGKNSTKVRIEKPRSTEQQCKAAFWGLDDEAAADPTADLVAARDNRIAALPVAPAMEATEPPVVATAATAGTGVENRSAIAEGIASSMTNGALVVEET
jgi:hypothetical protein